MPINLINKLSNIFGTKDYRKKISETTFDVQYNSLDYIEKVEELNEYNLRNACTLHNVIVTHALSTKDGIIRVTSTLYAI